MPHFLPTCSIEVLGLHCNRVELGRDRKGHNTKEKEVVHIKEYIHRDQCDVEEWKKRMVVGKLRDAHQDGGNWPHDIFEVNYMWERF